MPPHHRILDLSAALASTPSGVGNSVTFDARRVFYLIAVTILLSISCSGSTNMWLQFITGGDAWFVYIVKNDYGPGNDLVASLNICAYFVLVYLICAMCIVVIKILVSDACRLHFKLVPSRARSGTEQSDAVLQLRYRPRIRRVLRRCSSNAITKWVSGCSGCISISLSHRHSHRLHCSRARWDLHDQHDRCRGAGPHENTAVSALCAIHIYYHNCRNGLFFAYLSRVLCGEVARVLQLVTRIVQKEFIFWR